MPDPKKQHYIPQFLLDRFTTGKKRQLYVFDKTSDRSWRSPVRDVASENRYYDFEFMGHPMTFEQGLQELETRIAPIVRCIVESASLADLSDTDRVWLAYFILVQHLRTPGFEAQFDHLGALLANEIEARDGAVEGLEEFKSRTIHDRKLAHARMLQTLPRDLAPALLTKSWCLLTTTPQHPFMIGDAPLAMQNLQDHGPRGKLGLNCEGIEIYFPLSKNITLAMMCPTFEQQLRSYADRMRTRVRLGFETTLQHDVRLAEIAAFIEGFEHRRPMEISPDNVENLNGLQIAHAHRFVYAPADDFTLAHDMIRENPSFRIGPRMSVASPFVGE